MSKAARYASIAVLVILVFAGAAAGVWQLQRGLAVTDLHEPVVWGLYVIVLLQNHATERDPNFENSPVWKHMYLILFALQLGFTVVYLFDYLAS